MKDEAHSMEALATRVELSSLDRRIQEVAAIGGWELDLKSGSARWTEGMYSIYALPPNSPVTLEKTLSGFPGENQQRLSSLLQKCHDDGTRFDEQFQFVDDNGKPKHVRVIGESVHAPGGVRVQGTLQNLSHGATDQNAFQKEAGAVNAFFETSLDLLCILKKDGSPLKLSSMFTQTMGFEEDDLLNTPLFDLIHPRDIEKTKAAHAKMLSEKKTIRISNRLRKKSGSYAHFEWSASLDAETGLIYAAARDITQLIEQQDHLARVISNVPGMVYQFRREPDGRMHFPFVSSAGLDIYEMTEQDVRANPAVMLEAVHSDDSSGLALLIEESAENLTRFEWEGRIVTAKNKLRWVKAISVPHQEEDGGILWDGILLDITTEKTTEEELKRQLQINLHHSKLATIGELAAGVGHEVNNPLTIANGNIGLLARELKSDHPSRDKIQLFLEKYWKATERISNIVDGLRTFARVDDESDSVVDVGEIVDQTVRLVRDFYAKDGITLTWERPQEVLLVRSQRGKLQQVFMNLLSNARDAVDANGEKEVQVRVRQQGDRVVIEVEDNGPGIPESIQNKIFDAFFTTKPVGMGTGIGLSLTASIVKDNEGNIDFQTGPKGTRFQVELPLSVSSPFNSTLGRELTGGHRILLVDDEEGIRDVLRYKLEELGCHVVEAANGQEGLEKLEKQPFDTIVTDIRMPVMDGYQFIEKFVERFPESRSRIVVISGGPPAYSLQRAERIQDRIELFLRKPFSDDEVKQILSPPNPEGPSPAPAPQ